MLILNRKKHNISFWDCWYATESLPEKGIIRYHESPTPIGQHIEEFETLLTDLTETEEEIVARFSKSCKYKVNRAPREGVTVKCIEKEEIQDPDIEAFAKFYAEFYASKGYGKVDEEKLRHELQTYRDAGALSIHIAYVNEVPVVYHTHVITDEYARLFHSASLYRVMEEIPTTVVGMANRYLHKVDMVEFKKMGIHTYDWGGAGTADEVANITEFKESFGGTRAVLYHGREYKGLWAKMLSGVIS